MRSPFRMLLLIALGWLAVLPAAQAHLISFSPTRVDFGIVRVGEPAEIMLRFRYSGPDSGRTGIRIEGSPDLYQSPFKMAMPEAASAHVALDSIWSAIRAYHQDNGRDPDNVEQLIQGNYLHLSQVILQQWSFNVVGAPITQVEGVSTRQMPFGAGLTILLGTSDQVHQGWGVTSARWDLVHLAVYTLPLVFAPTGDSSYANTLQMTVFKHDTLVAETFTIIMTGNGLLEVKEPKPVVSSFILNAPYPNPFNSATCLSYIVPSHGWVTLAVNDQTGRQIALLENGEVSAGSHSISWNATGCPSGIYWASLSAGEFRDSKKLVMIR